MGLITLLKIACCKRKNWQEQAKKNCIENSLEQPPQEINREYRDYILRHDISLSF
jgi:hypothetical protein